MNRQPATAARVFLGYFVDIVAPLATYFVLHRLGVTDFWALVLGSILALVSTAINTIRRRKVDAVGLLVILEIAISIGLLFVTGDPRFLLAKPSFYTALAGVYIIALAFRGNRQTMRA